MHQKLLNRIVRPLVMLWVMAVIVGCEESATDTASNLVVEIVAGDKQNVGLGLSNLAPLRVRVIDSNTNQPRAGETVRWRSIQGGGVLAAAVTETDDSGIATNTVQLPSDPGEVLVLAEVRGSAVTFRLSGRLLFTHVTAGTAHTCALSTDRSAYCWGANHIGQLGDGTATSRSRPARVAGGFSFTSLEAGWSHTCGITVEQELVCWGDNRFGQLGTGDLNIRHSPTRVAGNHRFKSASGGYVHTCGVSTDGVVLCWGVNGDAQLGFARSGQIVTTPRAIESSTQFTKVAAGEFHSCAISTVSQLWCWGWNSSGETGTNATHGLHVVQPTITGGAHPFVQVSAHSRHTCGVGPAGDGRQWCWGRNAVGETGQPPFVSAPVPFPVASPAALSKIVTGNTHTCALDSAGALYCFGSLLADGTTGTATVPRRVGVKVWSDVAAGFAHSCGVSEGEVWCWGTNDRGQLGTTGARSLVPVRVTFPE